MNIGSLIRQLRIKKGFTQEELASKTELSARTIQRIENGEVDPRAYTLQMIAKALDVDYSIFIKDESPSTGGRKSKNDLIILALIHLSGLLLLFFPTVMIWNHQKYKVEEISNHFKDVISFQLTIWLICILPGIALYFFFNMNQLINKAPYMIIIGFALGVIFSITNAINVLNGKEYNRFNLFNWINNV